MLKSILKKRVRMTTIEDLPVEVLYLIMDYLKLKDKKSASLVCRSWEKIIFNRAYLKKVEFKVEDIFFKTTLWDVCINSDRPYVNLHIDGFYSDFEEVVKLTKKLGGSIESLRIECCRLVTTKILTQILAPIDNLKELSLEATVIRSDDSISTSHVSLRNLKRLKINIPDLGPIPFPQEWAPNVTELILCNRFNTNHFPMKNVQENIKLYNKQLVRLDINMPPYLDYEFFSFGPLTFDSLKEFNILSQRMMYSEDSVLLRRFFNNFRNSHVEKISLKMDVRNDLLANVFKNFRFLKHLHLNTGKLSADDFNIKTIDLSHLEVLHLDGLSYKPWGSLFLKIKLPKLHTLIIHHGYFESEFFTALAGAALSMKYIRLITMELTDLVVIEIATYLKNISMLTIMMGNRKLTANAYKSLTNLKNLTHFEFEITVEDQCKNFPVLPSVKRLVYYTNNPAVDNEWLEPAFPNLERKRMLKKIDFYTPYNEGQWW